MSIYIRSSYFKMLAFFLFVLYPFRYLVLSYNEESYVFSGLSYGYNLKDFSYFLVLFFSCSLFLIGFLMPKRSVLNLDLRVVSFVEKVFYVEFFLYVLSILFFGMRMGSQASIFAQIISIFIFSLVPFNFCVFLILLLRPDKIFRFCVLYLIPTILVASKSGLIHFFLMYLFSKMLKGERVFTWKNCVLTFFIFLLYPVFMVIASYGRNGKGDFLSYITTEMISYGSSLFKLYEFVIVKISKRISGVDVLLLNPQSNEVFSAFSVFLFFLKGIFTTTIFNKLQGGENFGMGRLFAIQYFGLDTTNASSFEPSLLGVVYLSNDPYFVTFFILFVLLAVTMFFNSLKGSLSKLVYSFFAYTLVMTVMTGLVTNLTQPLRFWFFFSVGFILYKRFFLRGYNEK